METLLFGMFTAIMLVDQVSSLLAANNFQPAPDLKQLQLISILSDHSTIESMKNVSLLLLSSPRKTDTAETDEAANAGRLLEPDAGFRPSLLDVVSLASFAFVFVVQNCLLLCSTRDDL